ERALARDPKDPRSRLYLCYHHSNLARTLIMIGRWAEGADEYGKGVAGLDKLIADFPAVLEYRMSLSDHRTGLGLALADLGRWDEAEAQLRKALDRQEQLAADFPTRAESHSDVGGSLDNLAGVMERTGRRTQAVTLYEQAIRRGEKALELNRQDEQARTFQISHHSGLGTLLTGLGRRAEAEAHLRRAVAL